MQTGWRIADLEQSFSTRGDSAHARQQETFGNIWRHFRLSHVGCACVCDKLLQSCPTLCDPMDCSLPVYSVHGILRQEYWSGLSCPASWPRHRTRIFYISCIGKRVLYAAASLVAQTVKRLLAMRETWVQSLGREDPLRRKWQPTPVLLPGKSHEQGSLAGCSPWGRKELDTTERLPFLFFFTCAPWEAHLEDGCYQLLAGRAWECC